MISILSYDLYDRRSVLLIKDQQRVERTFLLFCNEQWISKETYLSNKRYVDNYFFIAISIYSRMK